MKKILLAVAFVMLMVLGANAQSDGFFFNIDNGIDNRMMEDPNIGLNLPNTVLGDGNNSNAPIGSGLIVLTALGAGYALMRKREE